MCPNTPVCSPTPSAEAVFAIVVCSITKLDCIIWLFVSFHACSLVSTTYKRNGPEAPFGCGNLATFSGSHRVFLQPGALLPSELPFSLCPRPLICSGILMVRLQEQVDESSGSYWDLGGVGGDLLLRG